MSVRLDGRSQRILMPVGTAVKEFMDNSTNKRNFGATPGEMHNAHMKKFNSKLPKGDRRRMAVR